MLAKRTLLAILLGYCNACGGEGSSGASSLPAGDAGHASAGETADADNVAGGGSGGSASTGMGGATGEMLAGAAGEASAGAGGAVTLGRAHAICQRECTAGCYVNKADPASCLPSCDQIFGEGVVRCPDETDTYVACLGKTEPIYFCPDYDMSSPCAAEALAMISCIKAMRP